MFGEKNPGSKRKGQKRKTDTSRNQELYILNIFLKNKNCQKIPPLASLLNHSIKFVEETGFHMFIVSSFTLFSLVKQCVNMTSVTVWFTRL